MFELRSRRLCLRRLRHEDAPVIASYRSLPEVARFQSWDAFDLSDAALLVSAQESVEPNTPGTWLQLVLTTIDSAEVIGDCGIHFRADDPRQVELGITLTPNYQRSGFATEALHRVLEYVFDDLEKHRVTALTDAENQLAVNLFRRLAFRQEAHHVEHVWFKGAWGSEYLFALLHREWREDLTNP